MDNKESLKLWDKAHKEFVPEDVYEIRDGKPVCIKDWEDAQVGEIWHKEQGELRQA